MIFSKKNMMKTLKKAVAIAMIITQTASCQMKETPEWTPEICHPENKYRIELVEDKITTLQGIDANLPFGGSSGFWGDSGKAWTAQNGTPTGADVTYYSGYEDAFYHLDVKFPKEKLNALLGSKKFRKAANLNFGNREDKIQNFDGLMFGFAPKGMVVIWLRFGSVTVELDRFQATKIDDDKALEEKYFSDKSSTRKEIRDRDFIPDASPEKWDFYRKRSFMPIEITSENKGFKLFENDIFYFNGEKEIQIRPEILNEDEQSRAIPKQLNIFWETSNDEKFEGRIFFNEEKIINVFREIKNDQKTKLLVKISADNKSFELSLNGKKIELDSSKVYKSKVIYKDSYDSF